MQKGYEKSKANLEKYGSLVSLQFPEYDGKPNFTKFLDILGGHIIGGNWVGTISSKEYPKAFDMKLDYEDEDSDKWIKISYQGNPFYFVASTPNYSWCDGHIDAIIMLYEPVSRIVLFTFDYS